MDILNTDISSSSNRPSALPSKRWWWALGILFAVALLSLALVWGTLERVRKVELEITRRQENTQLESTDARLMAKQAQEVSRDMAAKVALLEGRLAEVSMQRGQLEELIQSLSRSRDENVVADIDAGLRIAQQQAAITGSAEPLVAALKQSDERLARHNQPRLEAVRRALARDLDRVKAVGVADIAALSIKLDEAVRLVDELPMLSQASLAHVEHSAAQTAPQSSTPPSQEPSGRMAVWWQSVNQNWNQGLTAVMNEVRSLVRVTRIDHPDAALLAPEQAFFVRENLKLRLLNARLALLSRQFDTTQNDLHGAQAMLNRYFDLKSRRTTVAVELLKQVAQTGRSVSLPRPDESLAALVAAAAGR
jgi:uroporphyrin-III C-methyltransferase